MRQVNVKEKPFDREKRIKETWDKNKTFKQSVSNRDGAETFVFYEGPPTANGLPHAGHVLGRVIKDFVARYKTMCGYQVVRKAGWDTHGLPVELGVEKQLGISGKKEIEAYGIEKFIVKCKPEIFIRASVNLQTGEIQNDYYVSFDVSRFFRASHQSETIKPLKILLIHKNGCCLARVTR
jgi:isoleucyl-tRNA synthetase